MAYLTTLWRGLTSSLTLLTLTLVWLRWEGRRTATIIGVLMMLFASGAVWLWHARSRHAVEA